MKFFKRLCGALSLIFAVAGIFFVFFGMANSAESFTFAYRLGYKQAYGINVNVKTHKTKTVPMYISHLEFEKPPALSTDSGENTPVPTADGIIFEGETVTALSFDFDSMEVKIISGDELKLETNNRAIKYSVDDGVLYLKADLTADDTRLTVTLPENAAFEWVKIDLDMGSVISEAALNTEKLTITTDVGEVEMKNITVSEYLSAESEMGSIELRGVINKEIHLKSDLGSVSCEINGKESDYGYKIDASLGHIKIGSAKAVTNGSVESGTDKANVITAECDLGNVTVSFK